MKQVSSTSCYHRRSNRWSMYANHPPNHCNDWYTNQHVCCRKYSASERFLYYLPSNTTSATSTGACGCWLCDWPGELCRETHFDAVREALFEAEHLKCHDRVIAQPTRDYYNLLGTAIAANQGPTVISMEA